mgnify:CR=1 FL=1
MQTLESKQIVAPEGYFVYDIKLTAAGRAKFEQSWLYWYRGGYVADRLDWCNDDESTWDYPYVTLAQWIDDIECEALSMECEPACKIGDEIINFVRDIDFVIEMRCFEADKMAQIAAILEDTHQTMETEIKRLGL